METHIKPYIGVTGIERSNNLEIYKYFPETLYSHDLMLGCIVSYKSIANLKTNPLTLTKQEMLDVFRKTVDINYEKLFLTFHYFTKSLDKVRPEIREKVSHIVTKPLSEQIKELLFEIYEEYDTVKPAFRIGVQINISWPDDYEIRKIKKKYPQLEIILQISDFERLEEKIKQYEVEHVLIDTSRGRGIEFEIDDVIDVYKIIRENSNSLIGFAGGFSPQNVEERVKILAQKIGTKGFSIDAQGKLRTRGHFDENKASQYISKAAYAFSRLEL